MTTKWLLECFRKGHLLSEEQYIPESYQPVNTPVLEHPVTKGNSLSKKEAVNTVQTQKADEDLLSQYVTNDSTVGKRSIHNILNSLCPVLAPCSCAFLAHRLQKVFSGLIDLHLFSVSITFSFRLLPLPVIILSCLFVVFSDTSSLVMQINSFV